jgi:hypothetical protein
MMENQKIKINRAPVLTLWATVVAERLGYSPEEALTLGKSVARLNAQSKGRRLGIYEDKPEEEKKLSERKTELSKPETVEILHRAVPVTRTPDGLRATEEGKPIDPKSVQRYLHGKFGDNLESVQGAMQALAQSYPAKELETKAYTFYEKFRPDVPEGSRGWGARGELDLEKVLSLKK